MTFYLQHGYGKGTKIDQLAATSLATGVTLSPADEDRDSLRNTAGNARSQGLQTVLDPQSYIYSARPQGVGRNHPSHGLRFSAMDWSQDATETRRQVEAVRLANENVNKDGVWIAPTALQSGFTDVWTPLALQLARTAIDSWGGDRTLASVAVDESAFATKSQVDDWLDVATTLDVKGFYILIQRGNTQYPPVAWAPDRLANLLSFIYTLGALNRFEVRWGYSDSEGLLGLAAGATSMGVGWSFGLRQFSTNKWLPTSGGKPAIIRVPMPSLWSSIRALGEADDLFSSGLRADAFTTSTLRRFPVGNFGSLTRTEAQDIYLVALAGAASRVAAMRTLPERLDYLQTDLASALDLHTRIANAGITLEPRYRPRVSAMAEALRLFRAAESL